MNTFHKSPHLLSNTAICLFLQCEGIAEDNEDEIVEVFSDANEENYLKAICVDVAGDYR